MTFAHQWRVVLCPSRKGEQSSGKGDNGKQQFNHFRLTAESIDGSSILGIGVVLIMAVLLVSTTSYADHRDGRKYYHQRFRPVSCEELAIDPANYLAGNPAVKSATSHIIEASDVSAAHCQVDILYGINPDQNINIRVGLPLNSLDSGTGGNRFECYDQDAQQ